MISKNIKLSSKSKIQLALWIILLVVIFIFHYLMTHNIMFSFIETLPYFVVTYFLYENFKSRDILYLIDEQQSEKATNYKIKNRLKQSKKIFVGILTIGVIGISILFLVADDKYAVARLLPVFAIAGSTTYNTVANYESLLHTKQ